MPESEAFCRRCRLHETRTQVVVGQGNPAAEVMFLGEAPGRQEDLLGRGFQGAAGKVFEDILAFVGLRRADIWLANAVRCRPSVDGKRNRAPQSTEILACHHWLAADLERVHPQVVVTLGRVAFESLTGLAWDGETRRAAPFKPPGDSWEAFGLYHPAYLIYRRDLKNMYRGDLIALRTLLADRGIPIEPADGTWAQ